MAIQQRLRNIENAIVEIAYAIEDGSWNGKASDIINILHDNTPAEGEEK